MCQQKKNTAGADAILWQETFWSVAFWSERKTQETDAFLHFQIGWFLICSVGCFSGFGCGFQRLMMHTCLVSTPSPGIFLRAKQDGLASISNGCSPGEHKCLYELVAVRLFFWLEYVVIKPEPIWGSCISWKWKPLQFRSFSGSSIEGECAPSE